MSVEITGTYRFMLCADGTCELTLQGIPERATRFIPLDLRQYASHGYESHVDVCFSSRPEEGDL